jgi:3,4-dihydroxy 2-butanone 4-phosphate synthase/GTP cyclohydrolase II
VDLARMAGLVSAGVICEIMNEDGTMARVPDLVGFCELHGLKMLTVASLIRYRLQHERSVLRVAETMLPTQYGEFRMIAYESEVDGAESHVALVYGGGGNLDPTHDGEAVMNGAPGGGEAMLVRVHTHCLAGDVFGSTVCDCRALVDNSLRMIAAAGRGALVYLHNGARGFGIERGAGKAGALDRVVLHRRAARDAGPVDACEERTQMSQRILRQTGLGGQILADLGIRRIRLLTNTPTHAPALQGYGIEIVEQVGIPLGETAATAR